MKISFGSRFLSASCSIYAVINKDERKEKAKRKMENVIYSKREFERLKIMNAINWVENRFKIRLKSFLTTSPSVQRALIWMALFTVVRWINFQVMNSQIRKRISFDTAKVRNTFIPCTFYLCCLLLSLIVFPFDNISTIFLRFFFLPFSLILFRWRRVTVDFSFT